MEQEKQDLAEQLKISNKNAKDAASKLAELIHHSEELKKIVKEDEMKIIELSEENRELSTACDHLSQEQEKDKAHLEGLYIFHSIVTAFLRLVWNYIFHTFLSL